MLYSLSRLFDDGLALDVAEERDFVFVLGADRMLGAADENIGLNTDLPQHADGVLRRLGLQLARRLK